MLANRNSHGRPRPRYSSARFGLPAQRSSRRHANRAGPADRGLQVASTLDSAVDDLKQAERSRRTCGARRKLFLCASRASAKNPRRSASISDRGRAQSSPSARSLMPSMIAKLLTRRTRTSSTHTPTGCCSCSATESTTPSIWKTCRPTAACKSAAPCRPSPTTRCSAAAALD